MASITIQRDLVVTLKKETTLNIGILSKLQPLSVELSSLILKENALEKPTQNLFNKLMYYLISILDSQVHASLTWPLYDTKAERTYRNELYSFISEYSSKGLLTPLMCSYLVNPSCFKVTLLLFQLSHLAVNRLLLSKIRDNKKPLYNKMNEKYLQKNESFVEDIEKETHIMLSKFSNYLCKRKIMEKIAMLFRKKIVDMENILATTNAQGYIDNFVDNLIHNVEVNDDSKKELLKIKNVYEQSSFFDNWLLDTDKKLDNFETTWDKKVKPILEKSMIISELTEIIIQRHTGQVERSSYTVEYDPKSDEICTNDLENQVYNQQKYILKNLQRDGRLNYPNLIRAFVISVCFILNNQEISNDVYKFNEYLESTKRNYHAVMTALRGLLERVLNAEAKLQPFPVYHQSVSFKEMIDIPPIPDLSHLKTNRDHYHTLLDILTPLNLTKHKFNLRRRTSGNFNPQPRSFAIPFYQPKEDFLKTLISCQISSYDANMTQNCNNLSVISSIKANETIAECSSGFTKQQIARLLSTKKTSSSKKYKYKQDRPDIKIKKGGLFNESVLSESNALFRSYSSPNLFENREKGSIAKIRARKLSIMKEDSPVLEVSGIMTLDTNSNSNTPQGCNAESSRILNTSSLPIIKVNDDAIGKINNVLNTVKVDISSEINMSPILDVSRKSIELHCKVETPKTNSGLIQKTSSLEKIINRFKKVRASVILQKDDAQTIFEEKENVGVNINKVLLPDLLSPTCAIRSDIDFDKMAFDVDKAPRRPRESLGTVLDIDHTFLDQFDLID